MQTEKEEKVRGIVQTDDYLHFLKIEDMYQTGDMQYHKKEYGNYASGARILPKEFDEAKSAYMEVATRMSSEHGTKEYLTIRANALEIVNYLFKMENDIMGESLKGLFESQSNDYNIE